MDKKLVELKAVILAISNEWLFLNLDSLMCRLFEKQVNFCAHSKHK
jgi:hypothetical protein